MKYPNNDMDDLFNKAGQDYPLRTDGKNWDAVKEALIASQPPAAKGRATRMHLRFLPLLLLLLVTAVFYVKEHDANQIPRDNQSEPRTSNETGSVEDGAPGDIESNAAQEPVRKRDAKEQRQDINDQTIAHRDIGGQDKTQNITDQNTSDQEITVIKKGTRAEIQPAANRQDGDFEKISNQVYDELKTLHGIAPQNLSANHVKHPQGPSSLFNNLQVKTAAHKKSSVPSIIKSRNNRSFYYGIKGGPDLSTIKGQRIEKAGYSIGITLGYRFHNRWSVDISGLWSRKKKHL